MSAPVEREALREELLVQCVGELGRGVVVLDGECGQRDHAAMALTLSGLELLVRMALDLVQGLTGEARP